MTLQEIAKATKPVYLVQAVSEHYEEAHIGYLRLLTFLQEAEPIDTKFTIHIDYVNKDVDGSELPSEECYHNVYGTTPDDPEENYSCSLSPWEEWASMRVDKETLKNYKYSEVLAHAIYEMTFYGWNQEEIEKVKKGLEESMAELNKWKEEGTLEEHTRTLEEVMVDLDTKLTHIRAKQTKHWDPFEEYGVYPY